MRLESMRGLPRLIFFAATGLCFACNFSHAESAISPPSWIAKACARSFSDGEDERRCEKAHDLAPTISVSTTEAASSKLPADLEHACEREFSPAFDDIVKCISANMTADAAANSASEPPPTRLGGWNVWKTSDKLGDHIRLGAGTVAPDGQTAMTISCDEQKGFEFQILGPTTYMDRPTKRLFVVLPGTAPIELEGSSLLGETGMSPIIAHHAEKAEFPIVKSKRVGIRFDDSAGEPRTYFFDFPDLAAGSQLLEQVCPA